jgi:hypothetical protein
MLGKNQEATMPAQASKPEAVTIASLAHDVAKRKSIVTLIWGDGSERRIALPIPYGTTLDNLHREAEAAVRQFAAELAGTPITAPLATKPGPYKKRAARI